MFFRTGFTLRVTIFGPSLSVCARSVGILYRKKQTPYATWQLAPNSSTIGEVLRHAAPSGHLDDAVPNQRAGYLSGIGRRLLDWEMLGSRRVLGQEIAELHLHESDPLLLEKVGELAYRICARTWLNLVIVISNKDARIALAENDTIIALLAIDFVSRASYKHILYTRNDNAGAGKA